MDSEAEIWRVHGVEGVLDVTGARGGRGAQRVVAQCWRRLVGARVSVGRSGCDWNDESDVHLNVQRDEEGSREEGGGSRAEEDAERL